MIKTLKKKKKYFTINKCQYFIQKIEILGKIINIHDYANELICIILLLFKEQFMRCH
jgi:hypothetical protein